VLAYIDTVASPTAAPKPSNLIIEKVRRLAHGFKDFDHYRFRTPLAASGPAPTAYDPAACSIAKTR
jgi:hypothetical protein